MALTEKLAVAWEKSTSLACVGLDPDPERMPIDDVAAFNRAIVDATRDLVCAYKLQLAFYEALGVPGLVALEATVRHIRDAAPHAVVIGDGKRGDIGSTARAYAKAMFQVWDFDAVTVNPYQGRDAVDPFLAYEDRGVFLVCRTSNPSSADLQDLRLDGRALYERVADAAEEWGAAGQVGLVVGAGVLDGLRGLRAAHPALPFLVPGVGAQGGDAAAVVRAGADAAGRGLVVSSSRHVIYASSRAADFAAAARERARELRDALDSARAG